MSGAFSGTARRRIDIRTAVFSTRNHDRHYLARANRAGAQALSFLEPRLSRETVGLAAGHEAVCVFVSDELDARVLAALSEQDIGLVALRCAGFNNVDLAAAARFGIAVVRVPEYSPHAVAEHAVALMLSLARKTHRAYNRVREGNFELDGLLGFDLYEKSVGIVGTGNIGSVVARILLGFGCRVVATDPRPDDTLAGDGVEYVSLDELVRCSKIVTLHCPLTPDTHHLIDAGRVAAMQPGCMLINTSRGAVIKTRAVIDGLKSGRIGHLGLDVYEEESDLFFRDLSDRVIQDDIFARLLTFPNVLITGHQGFFTHEALTRIAETTIANLAAFEAGRPQNRVSIERLAVAAPPGAQGS